MPLLRRLPLLLLLALPPAAARGQPVDVHVVQPPEKLVRDFLLAGSVSRKNLEESLARRLGAADAERPAGAGLEALSRRLAAAGLEVKLLGGDDEKEDSGRVLVAAIPRDGGRRPVLVCARAGKGRDGAGGLAVLEEAARVLGTSARDGAVPGLAGPVVFAVSSGDGRGLLRWIAADPRRSPGVVVTAEPFGAKPRHLVVATRRVDVRFRSMLEAVEDAGRLWRTWRHEQPSDDDFPELGRQRVLRKGLGKADWVHLSLGRPAPAPADDRKRDGKPSARPSGKLLETGARALLLTVYRLASESR